MNEYKYYMYYSNTGLLTAYTDDKEISKLFDAQRNRKYYNKEKSFLTKDEVNQLASRHYDKTLRLMNLYTVDDNHVTIAVTETERYVIHGESTKILTEAYTMLWDIDYMVFNKEIYNALNIVGVVGICEELNRNFSKENLFEENVRKDLLVNDLRCTERSDIFKIDELQVFLDKFGKLMKVGF